MGHRVGWVQSFVNRFAGSDLSVANRSHSDQQNGDADPALGEVEVTDHAAYQVNNTPINIGGTPQGAVRLPSCWPRR